MRPRPAQQNHAAAVVDVGSSLTRIGFAGEEAPHVLSRTVVGTPRHCGLSGSLLQHVSEDYAGSDAWEREGILNLVHPVQKSRIVSYEGIEHILQDAFSVQLPIIPSETPLLWVEATCTPQKERERLCELLFENLDIAMLGIAHATTTTVYSTGRTTGVVVDSGDGRTTVSAVWEGYNVQHALQVSEMAGCVLTDKLKEVLRERGYMFSTPQDRRVVEDIKHNLCYVAEDIEVELESLRKKMQLDSYRLPDDQYVYLHESQFMIPEMLFTPCGDDNRDSSSSNGIVGNRGLADLVTQVVQSAPEFTHPHLYASIVLGGGNTMFPGIEQRLQRDVTALRAGIGSGGGCSNSGSNLNIGIDNSICEPVNCVAFPDRDMAAWIGGSVLASMPTFQNICLTRDEYYEKGVMEMHLRV